MRPDIKDACSRMGDFITKAIAARRAQSPSGLFLRVQLMVLTLEPASASAPLPVCAAGCGLRACGCSGSTTAWRINAAQNHVAVLGFYVVPRLLRNKCSLQRVAGPSLR